MNSRLDRKPVELVKERIGMGLTVCSKYNAAQRILDSLKFGNSGFGCSIENRVCIVQAGTDQGMCYERSCVRVQSVPEMTKSFYMVETGLGNETDMFMKSKRVIKSDTKEFDTLSQWNS